MKCEKEKGGKDSIHVGLCGNILQQDYPHYCRITALFLLIIIITIIIIIQFCVLILLSTFLSEF